MNHPSIEVFTFCRDIRDNPDGSLLIDAPMFRVVVPHIPCKIGKLVLFIRLRFAASASGKHKYEITCTDLDEREAVTPIRGMIDAQPIADDEHAWANFGATLTNFPVKAAGDIRFDLRIDGRDTATTWLYVVAQ